MRKLRGKDGKEWDVVLGRESWGTVLAFFVPRSGEGEPLRAALPGASWDEAARRLLAMEEDDLENLMKTALPALPFLPEEELGTEHA